MYGMINRWQSSGLKQKDFCRREGINYYTFKYWKTQYTREHEFIQQKPDNSFISIESPVQEDLFSGIELTFPNGVKLSCNSGLQSDQVKQLIKLF